MLEYRLSKKLGGLAATLSAPRDTEIALALESNQLLPDRDIEFGALSLSLPSLPLLPVATGGDAAASLASFRELTAALAAADLHQSVAQLLPNGTGWRYSVLSMRLDAAAQGSAAAPLPQGVTASARGNAVAASRLAVIAAVPAGAGTRDHFRPILESVLVPSLIDTGSDIAEHAVLALECSGLLQASAAVKLGYDLTWLRAVTAGSLRADFGARVEPDAAAGLDLSLSGEFFMLISRDQEGWLRLQIAKTAKRTGLLRAGVQAASQANRPSIQASDSLTRALQTGMQVAEITGVSPLANNICEVALSALESKYAAQFSCQLQAVEDSGSLLDCSFDLEDGALPAWRQAVAGDLSGALRDPGQYLRFREALLSHSLSRESRIELHLPFLTPLEWQARLESAGKATIEQDGNGRLLVFTANAADRVIRKNQYQSALVLAGAIKRQPNFTLAYTDSRKTFKPVLETILKAYEFRGDTSTWLSTLSPLTEIDASLSLSLPGTCAEAWMAAPNEGDPAWSRLSCSIQLAMRRWLPFVYFSRLERYEDLAAAWPLIVYQASPPCQSKSLTYDVQNIEKTREVLNSSLSPLAVELSRIRQLLQQKGNKRATEFYDPGQAATILGSVARDPRLFNALLLADALFVDRLIELARRGREAARQNPEQALAGLTRFAAGLVDTFHAKLRTLYGGQDFLPFGSLLFLEATAALSATRSDPVPVQAILRAKVSGATLTFVNAHYVPESIQPAPGTQPQSPTPHPVSPSPATTTQPPATATQTPDPLLLSQLGVSADAFIQSALALYSQVCRCRILRKDLDEQTSLLDKLLKS